MASSKEYMQYVMDQLSGIDGVRCRAMMGEYVIYCRDKVVAGVYDDRFLVKNTKSSALILKNAPLEEPYPGGSKMFLVEDPDNRELLAELFGAVYNDLPIKKKTEKRMKK